MKTRTTRQLGKRTANVSLIHLNMILFYLLYYGLEVGPASAEEAALLTEIIHELP